MRLRNLALSLILSLAVSCQFSPIPLQGEYRLSSFYGIFENSPSFKRIREDASTAISTLEKSSYSFSEYTEDKANSTGTLTLKKQDTRRGIKYLFTARVILGANRANLEVRCSYSDGKQNQDNPEESDFLRREILEDIKKIEAPKFRYKKW